MISPSTVKSDTTGLHVTGIRTWEPVCTGGGDAAALLAVSTWASDAARRGKQLLLLASRPAPSSPWENRPSRLRCSPAPGSSRAARSTRRCLLTANTWSVEPPNFCERLGLGTPEEPPGSGLARLKRRLCRGLGLLEPLLPPHLGHEYGDGSNFSFLRGKKTDLKLNYCF